MSSEADISLLLEADDERYRATMASDVQALDALLTDDFT